jgi:effector-binding domain-containing protein
MKQRIKKSILLLFVLFLSTMHFVNAQEPISRITMQPMKLVYVVDSVAIADSISPKMGKAYAVLFKLINQQQLKPGKVLGIYYTATPPWVFDIAVEVDREPAQLNDGVQFKTIVGGEAIVFHFKGPYENIHHAYQQIDEWLSKNNKLRAGPPMEVYLNNPVMVKDKNELLTDIYQLIITK